MPETSLSFPNIPYSSKDVVNGGKSTSINGPSSFTDRSYLLTVSVGLNLSKSPWTAVKLELVLPRTGEVALDVRDRLCGGEREARWLIPGSGSREMVSTLEMVMVG